MTVTVAWRQDRDIFLIADSALTYPLGGAPAHPRSGAGESQTHGAFRLEEAGAKVIPLSSGAVATYTGDSQAAIAALLHLRDALATGTPLHDALAQLVARFEHSEEFSLVVAARGHDRDELWIVEPRSPTALLKEIYEDGRVYVAGSLPNEAGATIQQMITAISEIRELARNPDRLHASAIMGMQSFGQRAPLWRDHAGGTFFGARLSRGNVAFQKDLVYALYARENLETKGSREHLILLWSGIRKGLLINCSSVTDGYRVFLTPVHRASHSDIDGIMQRMIRRRGGWQPLRASQYAFIDRRTGALAHVYSPSEYPCRFLTVALGTITVQPLLRDILLTFPAPEDVTMSQKVPHLYLEDQ